MPRFAVVSLSVIPLSVILGCGATGREADCARVREIAAPDLRPRRGGAGRLAAARAAGPGDVVQRGVRRAVEAVVAEAGAVRSYSPYRAASEPPGALDRLAGLCGLRRVTVVAE